MKKTILVFMLAARISYIAAQEMEDPVLDNITALQKQLKYLKEDTSGARLLNDLATAFYNNSENDSCKKYAAKAMQLADKLLNQDAVKRNPSYTTKCKLLKAQAIESIGSALYYENTNAAFDTLQAALKLWMETGNKEGMASTYSRIGELYSAREDYVKAINYFKLSLSLFKQTGNMFGVGMSYYQAGLNQRYMGNYGDALESFVSTLKIGRQINDIDLITSALLGNGFNYMLVKNYAEAQKNQQEALKIFTEENDAAGIATAYNDMGVTNIWAGNLDDALKNHFMALAIRRQLTNYGDIGNSYSYISDIFLKQGKYPEALSNCIEGLKYKKLNGDIRFIMDSYMDAGDIYLEMSDDENALKNYDTVLSISREINNRGHQADALIGIAGIFLSRGKTNEAITWLRKAEAVADPNDFRNLRSIYKYLSEAFVRMNDYKNAYKSEVKFKQMSDSLTSAEKSEKIASLTNQLEFENRQALQKASQDKQLAIQQSEIDRQKLVRNISIAGLFVVIVLALIAFVRFREKRKLNIALQNTLTDLKSTQSQLIQSEKMASLGELTAGIAHEIQNPLNFVNNFSDVNKELLVEMKDEIDKGNINEIKVIANDVIDNENKINYHGKRAETIVKGMLQHSRSSSGLKEPTDINALADEYLRLSYHGLRAKEKSFNAGFKTDFDETIDKINIVPQDIGRVLLNLFNNAFYAVNEKKKHFEGNYEPTISVTTKKTGNKVEIKVKDNGNGIPQNIVDKIFQPFFTTKPTGQGTGLGLSLSYDIVKAHGGELKVETPPADRAGEYGEGTVFILSIPFV